LTDQSKLVLNFDDFLLIVASASFANSVWHHKCSTFATFNKVHSAHFPVRSSLVTSSFGRFVLRTNGHRLHLLKFTEYITDSCHAGILRLLLASAGTFVQVLPAAAADTFTVFFT